MSNDTESVTAEDFTPDRTRELLAEACAAVSLDPAGASLLRHQTNAVYLLATSPVVVKIARPDYSVEHIHRVVDLTRWLTKMGVPVLPLLDVDQPVIVGGCAVTYWPYLEQTRPIQTADMATALRELHALPEAPVAMPTMDAVAAIRYSLSVERILTPGEHHVLADRCEDLASQLPAVRYQAAAKAIHGDPQHGNTLWDGSRALLCDWDSAAIGNPEWDLITIEVHSRRFGHDPGSYRKFCDIYGRDIRDWDGYAVLRGLRELRMITTNARKSPASSPAADEVRKRVAQLSRDEPDARWSIL
ncbi:MAG TPA: aminoglycoside phosphotransferase family protein [Streptosporangiaceae bacterium]|nr:aminoglycoside phosphotransferase family protein [Streptosporangiaceae bacterium]